MAAGLEEMMERLLRTKAQMVIELNDVGITIGNRRFSFSGKLVLGPVSVGERKD